jgi:hypothetical protein
VPENLLDQLQNLLLEHQNKAYISCDENCFCWSVQELIASIAEENAAHHRVQWIGGILCDLESVSTPQQLPAPEADTITPTNH